MGSRNKSATSLKKYFGLCELDHLLARPSCPPRGLHQPGLSRAKGMTLLGLAGVFVDTSLCLRVVLSKVPFLIFLKSLDSSSILLVRN